VRGAGLDLTSADGRAERRPADGFVLGFKVPPLARYIDNQPWWEGRAIVDLKHLETPALTGVLPTAIDFQVGPPMAPLKQLYSYDSDEWEAFILEWAFGALQHAYTSVQRFTGAGDKGVDIAGFSDEKLAYGVWDNFQCKHYGKPLAPSDAWVEIGKMLWYSFQKEFSAPRAYYFVAPREVGTKLRWLLARPEKLKEELFAAWEKNCQKQISSQEVKLEGDFRDYCSSFDYKIFKPATLLDILEQHKTTPYYVLRFGGGLGLRPTPEVPPDEVDDEVESRYVGQLLLAYADHTKEEITDLATLKKWSKLDGHFKRQREAFYHAESLRVFVRDKTEPGTFESLQEQIYKGVVDTSDSAFPDGFERVKAVTKAAQDLSLQAHPLAPSAMLEDRHGICHQLSNEDRLKWTE